MKKVIFFTIILVSILIINNLVHSIYTLWQKQELVVKAQKELEIKKKENQDFKNRLSIAKSEQFVEEEARNKLFMAKPGEAEILIDKDLIKASNASKLSRDQKQAPNWEKWWELFFK